MSFYKGYKIRLFPTPEQEELMWEHIRACRTIWNLMIEKQNEQQAIDGKYIGEFDMINMLTDLKKQEEYKWLTKVSNASLTQTCRELHRAYTLFFKGIFKHPQFKSYKDRRKYSFPLTQIKIDMYFVDENYVKVPKMKRIKYKSDFKFGFGRTAEQFTNPRISYKNGKWILSVNRLEENTDKKELSDKTMGIDLGIRKLAVASFGNEIFEFGNINKSRRVRKLETKMKHYQRLIQTKLRQNGRHESNNLQKIRTKFRKVCAKLSNIRLNYTHQTTTFLVNKLPMRVVMEDLQITKLMKNKSATKQISNQRWKEFVRQMEYKCQRKGIEFILADRYFPSSQICSSCGFVYKKASDGDEFWICPNCKTRHNRDVNASINLMNYMVQGLY